MIIRNYVDEAGSLQLKIIFKLIFKEIIKTADAKRNSNKITVIGK